MNETISYTINGREYSEDEIISAHEFWQEHCDTEDIEDAIEHVINYDDDEEFASFVANNTERIRRICKKHLLYWHNVQESTLDDAEKSIFWLARHLIICIYYDNEGKTPSKAKQCLDDKASQCIESKTSQLENSEDKQHLPF